jgi:hypothetical protein
MHKPNAQFVEEHKLGQKLKIQRKAKGTIQVLRIAINRGAHTNLSSLRGYTKRLLSGQDISASIIIRRAFEVYLAHLFKLLNLNPDKGKALREQECRILEQHLSKGKT